MRRLGLEQLEKRFASPLRRSLSGASRANFAALPLLRPARQNRHATQATPLPARAVRSFLSPPSRAARMSSVSVSPCSPELDRLSSEMR